MHLKKETGWRSWRKVPMGKTKKQKWTKEYPGWIYPEKQIRVTAVNAHLSNSHFSGQKIYGLLGLSCEPACPLVPWGLFGLLAFSYKDSCTCFLFHKTSNFLSCDSFYDSMKLVSFNFSISYAEQLEKNIELFAQRISKIENSKLWLLRNCLSF